MNDTEIQAWNDFANDLRRRVRWDLARIDSSLKSALEDLPGLTVQERTELLKMGKLVAERSSKLGVTFLRTAARAASSIPPSCRTAWSKWAMGFAEHSRETLLEFVERSPEILRSIPEEECHFFLDCGLRVFARDPSASYKFFIHLPQIREQIPKDQFPRWFGEGLSLVPGSLSAALAYFGLESKRSLEGLRENGCSVSLAEVFRPLKLFAQALTGRSLGIRPLREKGTRLTDPLGALPFTDGETIFLPEIVDQFPTSRLNFLGFKLAAAHQAGYVEFGTFAFRLSSVYDLFSPEYLKACLRGISDKGKEISSLEVFFHLFPRRSLAQDLFRLLEGGRVDQCLKREYRGLKGEIDLFVGKAMANRPAPSSLPLQEAILESILRFFLFGKPPGTIPRHSSFPEGDLISLLSSLLERQATVKDSARAAVALYRRLAALPNIPRSEYAYEEGFESASSVLPPLLAGGAGESVRLPGRGDEQYRELAAPAHWGELRPDLVRKKIRIRKVRELLGRMEMTVPLSPEALKELLDKGVEWELEIFQGDGENGSQGLLVTDLPGMKAKSIQEALRGAGEKLKRELQLLINDVGEEPVEKPFYYDEWDYQIRDYRVKWCRLKEREIESGSTRFVDRTLEAYSDLVAEVRRQFQMLKPERFKKIPHLERGEEIDLDAAIEASVDRRAGQSPSEKIYIERNRKDRDFSTLFLLDMSASTDERVEGIGIKPGFEPAAAPEKKVIDIEKEALVVMAEALEEIGDEYAIFGFSGYGRKEVDFYSLKNFGEGYGDRVKGRIEMIKPQRSTRMGTAIRHSVEKMEGRDSKVKNLIMISDGYPQDYDYGDDRSDKEYALRDTTVALEEAGRRNIHVFCITVDRAGHDYLRKMLPPSRYLVIEETGALPRELPKIYRRLTT
jgi:hypothetical protein